MRISTRASYSLEALLVIALQGEGNLVSTRQIAEETGITTGYLEQLFIPLKKVGIIESVRGVQGGYKLAKRSTEVTVAEVFEAVERDIEFKSDETFEEQDPVKTLWEDIYSTMHSCVSFITLQHLVDEYGKGVA